MNASSLKPWIQPNGTIVCAHCNCMAGLGEACSHIAATMYAIMSAVQLQASQSACTSMLCHGQWLAPAQTKKVYNSVS